VAGPVAAFAPKVVDGGADRLAAAEDGGSPLDRAFGAERVEGGGEGDGEGRRAGRRMMVVGSVSVVMLTRWMEIFGIPKKGDE
jgi:hypothetical protein